VTNFSWNLTGFPWPSNESMISRTSHNRIKVEFMGAIVQWRGGIIKDSNFPLGLNQKSPGFPKLHLQFLLLSANLLHVIWRQLPVV
jgi:hypothetical protein